MIFSILDVESLSRTLSHWEWAEYISEAFVIVACAGEFIADLERHWLTEARKKHIQRRSTILLVAALSASLLCLIRTNELSGGVIGYLGQKSDEATRKTIEAVGDSTSALKQSAQSLDKSNAAEKAVEKTQRKIAAVNNRAEEIDSDLARTQYLLSARSVTNLDSLIRQLKQYKGQTVHFGSYNSEPDEAFLCYELSAAARSAGMNVPQDECGRFVPVGNPSTGVAISGPNIQQTMDLAQILLHTVDLGAGGVVSGIKATELRILVGAKPPFMMGQARGIKIPPKNK